MKARHLLALPVAALLLTATLFAAEKAKLDLKGVKCAVNGKGAAKANTGVAYKGGKVYFCCNNCPKAFAKDTKKFATRANHQLVQTKQAKQGACPLSGGKLDPKTAIKVNGAAVCFCCNNCKGAVAKLKGDAQVEKVFSEKAFAKAKFAVPKKKES